MHSLLIFNTISAVCAPTIMRDVSGCTIIQGIRQLAIACKDSRHWPHYGSNYPLTGLQGKLLYIIGAKTKGKVGWE